jgi:hypothetical protein
MAKDHIYGYGRKPAGVGRRSTLPALASLLEPLPVLSIDQPKAKRKRRLAAAAAAQSGGRARPVVRPTGP